MTTAVQNVVIVAFGEDSRQVFERRSLDQVLCDAIMNGIEVDPRLLTDIPEKFADETVVFAVCNAESLEFGNSTLELKKGDPIDSSFSGEGTKWHYAKPKLLVFNFLGDNGSAICHTYEPQKSSDTGFATTIVIENGSVRIKGHGEEYSDWYVL